MCLEDNCAKVCCSVLYLLDTRKIDGNVNFKNFATVQTAQKTDYIIKVIEPPIPLLL